MSTGRDEPETATTGPVATDDPPPEEGGASGRRPMKRSTRIALAVIIALALIAAVAFTASYFLDARQYVTTDNAQIDGTQIPIVAPTSGTLVGWTGTQGAVLRADQVVGRVEIDGGYVRPQRSIRAPAAGTVAQDDTTDGAYVTAGTQLAIAYDPSDVYVTARVDETDINDVSPGQVVDFTVDAYRRPHVHRLGAWNPGRRRRGLLAAAAVEQRGELPEGHPGDPREDRDRRPPGPGADPRHERRGRHHRNG